MRLASALRSFDPAQSMITAHARGACDHAHRHDDAYAAIVLDGGYDEVSADGAACIRDGDIVIHPPFHAHRNRFEGRGAVVLNIVLPAEKAASLGYRVFRSGDIDDLIRLARRAAPAAADAIIEAAVTASPDAPTDDWIETAIDHLRADPTLTVAAIANAAGYTPAHFSRACTARYGAGPAALRAEYRFRNAFRAMLGGARPAAAASVAGYADQAHFTRACRRITGTSPAALLRDIKSVQDAAFLRQ